VVRVLMMTTPGLGHFTPLVNVGRALQKAGDTVAVATAPNFGDAVTARGFDVVPTGISMVEAFGRARAADPAWMAASQEEIGRRIIPDVWVAQFATAMMDDVGQLTGWRPDVVVREEGEFASTLIAAMLAVPCVDVGWGPMRPAHLVDVAAEALGDLWRRYGLQPRRNAGVYEWLYLDPCPPSLQPVHADTVDTLHRVQPVPMTPAPPTVELPHWFDRLDGRPVVYVTLGTSQRSTTIRCSFGQ
jgi:glycosyltransferase